MGARKSRSGVAGGAGRPPPVVKIAKILPVSCPTVVAFVSGLIEYRADLGVYTMKYHGGASSSARFVSFTSVWLVAGFEDFVWLVPGPQIVASSGWPRLCRLVPGRRRYQRSDLVLPPEAMVG